MKNDVHPTYYQTTASCACGSEVNVGSTRESIKIEICSSCHPFFTGKQKLVDTEGRIDRFRKKFSNFDASKITK